MLSRSLLGRSVPSRSIVITVVRKGVVLNHLLFNKRCATGVCAVIVAVLATLTPVAWSQNQVSFNTLEVEAIAAQGPWPMAMPADVGNELSGKLWAEKLGETLFNDPSLSSNQAISCATCHQIENGFSDQLPVAIGLEKGVRNTQGLLDVGLQRWFGWDGGADSLWSASIRPMLNKHEMGLDISSLGDALRDNKVFVSAVDTHASDIIFDGQAVSATADLNNEQLAVVAGKSMAAFMRTLRSQPTEFDLFRVALLENNIEAQAAYSNSAKRGLKIFIGEANCRMCHFGANFSNAEFHDTGRPFFTGVGQVDPGRYTGIERVKNDPFNLLGQYAVGSSDVDKLKTSEVKLGQINWGQWRTPSLRNLSHTAPYMHDGSLQTLRDVVDAYVNIDTDRLHAQGESILKPLDLNDAQRDDLVEFLLSLSVK